MNAEAINRLPVPDQYTGGISTTRHTIRLQTAAAAKEKYDTACRRLLDVNRWHELCGPLSASFQLTDKNGYPLEQTAREGNYIRIELPAPGNKAGQGYDWVVIEKIEEHSTQYSMNCYTAMRVRPSGNPAEKDKDTAHFYRNAATSTFVVELNGNRLRASVYGRNEKPNTAIGNIWNVIRNATIAISAMLGFHKPQWKTLVKAFLG